MEVGYCFGGGHEFPCEVLLFVYTMQIMKLFITIVEISQLLDWLPWHLVQTSIMPREWTLIIQPIIMWCPDFFPSATMRLAFVILNEMSQKRLDGLHCQLYVKGNFFSRLFLTYHKTFLIIVRVGRRDGFVKPNVNVHLFEFTSVT